VSLHPKRAQTTIYSPGVRAFEEPLLVLLKCRERDGEKLPISNEPTLPRSEPRSLKDCECAGVPPETKKTARMFERSVRRNLEENVDPSRLHYRFLM